MYNTHADLCQRFSILHLICCSKEQQMWMIWLENHHIESTNVCTKTNENIHFIPTDFMSMKIHICTLLHKISLFVLFWQMRVEIKHKKEGNCGFVCSLKSKVDGCPAGLPTDIFYQIISVGKKDTAHGGYTQAWEWSVSRVPHHSAMSNHAQEAVAP